MFRQQSLIANHEEYGFSRCNNEDRREQLNSTIPPRGVMRCPMQSHLDQILLKSMFVAVGAAPNVQNDAYCLTWS